MRLVDIDDVRSCIKDTLGINAVLVYSGDKWEDILDSIPTAYDVDKVIEELMKLGVSFKTNCSTVNTNSLIMASEAIEIVKARWNK